LKAHSAALSGAVVAQAYYLSQGGERSVTPAGLERAKRKWERMERRRSRLTEQIEDWQQLLPVEDVFARIAIPKGSKRSKISKASPNTNFELTL
jgi:hypothetical protein